ncbi:MAG TPA: S8 family serine peptidase, partial [Acidimicrobiales bacterium]|nr:S8 family serine peptidase [Acidimicrobiales bacterium]
AIDNVDQTRVDAGIAVLDSGVAVHPDLGLVSQVDCTRAGCPSGGDDRYGHGTHVAGSAAAIDNGFGVVGVAHGARLYSVKVLGDDGGGFFSDIIAGIDWATARPGAIDVINMSLSGQGHLDSLDRAIDNAVGAGIAVVVAAGNNSGGAVDIIPANHPEVLAVSALADTNGVSGGGRGYCSGSDDHLATVSNFGANVDVIAPGTCILSTLPGGYGTKTGTSMAAPHVAGAAALLAANGRSVAGIRSTILGEGNFNWIDTSGDGRKEPLLDVSSSAFTVAGAGSLSTTTSSSTTTTSTSTTTSSTSTTTSTTTVPTTTTVLSGGNRAPTAIIGYECRRLGCRFDGTASSDSDGTLQSYEWDFGDGSRASGSVVQHTYQAAGSYTVRLTVVDDDGAVASATASLNCTLSSGRVTCR